MVLGFHIGTEPHTPDESTGVYFRGPGGAVLNYVETTYGGQRCVTQLISSGALDRHPDLRVLVSEGGATRGSSPSPTAWTRRTVRRVRDAAEALQAPEHVPLRAGVRGRSEHDRSAVKANTALGWQNVMWGSDYPHLERRRPQPEGVARAVRRRRRRGAAPHHGRRLRRAVPARARGTRQLDRGGDHRAPDPREGPVAPSAGTPARRPGSIRRTPPSTRSGPRASPARCTRRACPLGDRGGRHADRGRDLRDARRHRRPRVD